MIDEREKARPKGKLPPSEAQDHVVEEVGIKGTQKTVTDPTTGREVVIEDINKNTMDRVKNPMVSHCQAILLFRVGS